MMGEKRKLVVAVAYEQDAGRQIVRISFEGQLIKTDDSDTSTAGAMDKVFADVKEKNLEIAELVLNLEKLTFIDDRTASRLVDLIQSLAPKEVKVFCLDAMTPLLSRPH